MEATAKKTRGWRPGYGWVIVALIFSSMGVAIGTAQYAFGVFVEPLEEQFGWTRTQINASLSFFAVGGLAAPFVGKFMDRFGARPVMTVSLLLFAVSYLLRPYMTELWQWYALSAIQFLGLPGAAMLPAGKLIGAWYPKNRGRMLGISMMGANFGGLSIPILASFLVTRAGWQGGYNTFGLMCLAVAIGALVFIRDRPVETAHESRRPVVTDTRQDALQGVDVSTAVRTRSFYAVILAFLATSFTYQAVLSQIIPHLQNEGMALQTAALFLGFAALFGMAGKVVFGFLTERYPARYVLIGGLVTQSVGIMIMIIFPTSNVVWLAAPIYGLALGGTGVLFALIIQETFGLKNFGTIFGITSMATAGSALLGPLMVGVIFDMTGSYAPAFWIVIGIFTVGMLAAGFAKPVVQPSTDSASYPGSTAAAYTASSGGDLTSRGAENE